MAGYRHLLDTPSIPRMLEILLECEEGREEYALLQALGDETHAAKAVDILLKHGIIAREKGRIRICRGERGDPQGRADRELLRGRSEGSQEETSCSEASSTQRTTSASCTWERLSR